MSIFLHTIVDSPDPPFLVGRCIGCTIERWDDFGNGGGGGCAAMHRATRAYTPRQHLRMWQLRGLLAADERTDGRTGPQPRNAPHVTHMLPAGLSFHVGDDPPAGDVSLQPARPLPRINVLVYEAARKSGSCGNRAAPLLCGGVVLRGRRSWKPLAG